MGGVNLIYGLGMLDLGMTFSYEQLVIDAEIATMVNRVLRGIEVSDATLAVDVINEVQPGGTFLGEQHTIDFMKSESSQTKLFDRTMRSSWAAAGETDVKERANAMVQKILTEHKPTPLEQDAADKIRAIIVEAEKELL
jgi:trimethylamine--corrinoid protein Co-methyltransferase